MKRSAIRDFQEAPVLTLYFAPGSSSMAPHIALHEIGAAFTPRPMSFHRHDMRTPEFLALNPDGKVPLLLIDGRPLTEVAAILFYLARTHPAAGLLPADTESEAQAVSWMSFIASTLHPARQRGPEAVEKVWAVAQQKLGARDWALGTYSVVDIHLFRLFWRLVGSIRPDRARFAALYAHFDRMMARPAVIRTIADEAAIGYELPA
jgi:glutathione S-transferase